MHSRCGCSSSGRAPPCQGGGSEFEPRHPLQTLQAISLATFFYSPCYLALRFCTAPLGALTGLYRTLWRSLCQSWRRSRLRGLFSNLHGTCCFAMHPLLISAFVGADAPVCPRFSHLRRIREAAALPTAAPGIGPYRVWRNPWCAICAKTNLQPVCPAASWNVFSAVIQDSHTAGAAAQASRDCTRRSTP